MLIIAHRGGIELYRENSLDAIKHSVLVGSDMTEIDVRVTRDGIPILHHDEFIMIKEERIFIKKEKLEELLEADTSLITLEQALKLPKVKYLLEIKPKTDIDPIVNLIKKYDKNRIHLLTSFDFKLIVRMRNKLPDTQFAILEKWSGVRASYRARILDAKIIIINQRWVWSGFVKSFKNSNYSLYVYTLNDSNKASRWKKLGVSGVITDKPSQIFKHTRG